MLRNKNEDLQVQLEKYQNQPTSTKAAATATSPVENGVGGIAAAAAAAEGATTDGGPDGDQQPSLKALKAELSQADDRLREVQAAMAETQAELQRARQRERLNEDHSARLTATVGSLSQLHACHQWDHTKIE